MSNNRVVIKVEVGRLFYGTLRNAVKELTNSGYYAKLDEGCGFFSRPMWLTVDREALPPIRAWLKRLEECGD